LQWARALGADEVVAISHSDSKKEDAMKMGATKFVVHSGQGKGLKDEISDLDLIVSTVDVAGGIPLVDLLSAVNVQGRVIMVGIPDDPLPQMAPTDFAPNGAMLGFTHIGVSRFACASKFSDFLRQSKKECYKMLELAVKHNVKTYVIPYPMKDAGKAVTALHEGNGSVRYRQVLKQDLVTPAPERK
jgi:alcohol dehydrogenase (NADP+)